jgi:hypothetical protein
MRTKIFVLITLISIVLSVTYVYAEVKTMKGLNVMPIPAKVIQTE